ncbi:MAG: hypothetical protein WCK98_01885 [bacterium]
MSKKLIFKNLHERIEIVHKGAYNVCHEIFGEVFKNSGNIGIFCQTENEYKTFEQLATQLTKKSTDLNQKYFELLEPIKLDFTNETISYTHLYIRKPEANNYGKNLGDIDFRLDKIKFESIYEKVLNKTLDPRVGIYIYKNLTMLEVKDLSTPALAYLAVPGTAEKMRFRF